LALLEAPERRRERAHVHRLRRHIEEMREQAADLAIENADELAALGHRDAEQFLGCQTERVFLIHRRDVIEPVEVGQRLQVGLVLDQLLGPAVQKADMGVDALDELTVELQDEAQYAVSRRMLGPEIESEIAQGGFGHNGLASAAVQRRSLTAVPALFVTPGQATTPILAAVQATTPTLAAVKTAIRRDKKMSKEELIQFEGLVIEILPDARYRVQLDAGYEVVAYTAGKMKKNPVQTLAGAPI